MRARRALVLLGVVLVAALAGPSAAFAHAVLITASPPPGAKLASSPSEVRLRFSEPVQLLGGTDLTVVDHSGQPATAGPGAVDRRDHSAIQVPLRPDLAPGTYTVRYRAVSADSHVIGDAYVFGIGGGDLGPPFLGGAGGGAGPGETSAWAVSARFLELVGLGGLLGIMAFRWLVWRRAWRDPSALTPSEQAAALEWGRDSFWTAFGVLAIGAMLAEGYLLVVKTASGTGTSVGAVLSDPNAVSSVLNTTRFGTLLQARGALFVALFALGAWRFLVESSARGAPTPARPAGRPLPALVMAGLSVAALMLVSTQGHASRAPLPALETAADAVHLGSVAIWLGGLACIGALMLALPRVAPGDGGVMAARALALFSRVALIVVSLAIVTGVARSVGELSAPEQLWETAYGRSIIYKLLLLCPVAFLALRNRRVVTALRQVRRPNAATLRMVRRGVAAELTIALGIVVVASILVAQVPGRI